MSFFQSFFQTFIDIFLDMSLYMLIGMLLTGVLHVFMKKDTVAKHLGNQSRFSSVKAAVVGVPLPLCSCGVLPTTVYLSQNGATTAAVMAFLISTPQTGIDSIVATFGMMGVVFAVYRPAAAFIAGAVGGVVIEKIVGNQRIEQPMDSGCDEHSSCCDAHSSGCDSSCCSNDDHCATDHAYVLGRIKNIFQYAFVEFIDDIALHFVIGVFIAAVITLIIPTSFFTEINIGSGILGMLVMLIIGLPMYICSTSSIPIALALMAKGISPGAAFVFLFAGPATNAASISVLAKSVGRKTVTAYLIVTAVSAVGLGLLLDGIIQWFSLPMPIFESQAAIHQTSVLKVIAGILFGIVLLKSLGMRIIKRMKARQKSSSDH